jgi:ribonuclease BN (tRNA processing enzyme)
MAAMGVELLVAGAGDAFGSGGRLQTCFCLSGAGPRVLIDCGTTALIGLKRADVDPNDVEAIVVSHLHGDHFGGIPFFVLDGQFRHRERDLLVAGPPGTSERLRVAMDAFFPGSPGIERRFRLDVVELCPGEPTAVGPAIVTGFEVMHASGAPALSVRVGYGGHVVAYSGDTEWTSALLDAADGADLFLCEAYFFERKVRYHLDWATVRENREKLRCGRIALTHMSAAMLSRLGDLPADVLVPEDGTVLTV